MQRSMFDIGCAAARAGGMSISSGSGGASGMGASSSSSDASAMAQSTGSSGAGSGDVPGEEIVAGEERRGLRHGIAESAVAVNTQATPPRRWSSSAVLITHFDTCCGTDALGADVRGIVNPWHLCMLRNLPARASSARAGSCSPHV